MLNMDFGGRSRPRGSRNTQVSAPAIRSQGQGRLHQPGDQGSKGRQESVLSALVVVGNEDGRVGFGLGKAREVPAAIKKGIEIAKKNLTVVPREGSTIAHEVVGVFGAGRVLLKPASQGTGVIAGGPVRAVIELAGIKDILTKSLGTANPKNVVEATMVALLSLRSKSAVAELRGKDVSHIEAEIEA